MGSSRLKVSGLAKGKRTRPEKQPNMSFFFVLPSWEVAKTPLAGDGAWNSRDVVDTGPPYRFRAVLLRECLVGRQALLYIWFR